MLTSDRRKFIDDLFDKWDSDPKKWSSIAKTWEVFSQKNGVSAEELDQWIKQISMEADMG